jgi:transposase, IS5 family
VLIDIPEKGANQRWHCGMKLRTAVNSETGRAHSAVVTAANVHNKHPRLRRLHSAQAEVYCDIPYASQQALMACKAPQAKNAVPAFVPLAFANSR